MATESPFSKIPSQLDQIPNDIPVVFISYSWDNDEHIQWVGNLSRDLREKYRIYTLLDQYNRGGDDLITFMTKGLERADRVLIIGTPQYKEKLEKQTGGAKFEDQVITIKLYKEMTTRKFIPVLREGTFPESFNELIETRKGYDFRNDADYEQKLQELAADIWGCPMNTSPILGPKPNFTPASQVLQPLIASTPQDFATIVKSYLYEPSKQILLTEMIEEERDVVYNKILKHASYNYQTTAKTFNSYLKIHQDAIVNLINITLPIVRYGNIDQQRLLIDAMVKLCTKPFINGEITTLGTDYVHLFASTFLYHTMGLAAVKYGRFKLIKLLFETKVPAPNVFSLSYSCPLEYMAGCNHWDTDSLNNYLNASWIYPYSQMVMNAIKNYFGKTFINDNDFKNSFYVWEHLASLLCNYYKCQRNMEKWFPIGGFINKRFSLNREEDDFYTNFFRQAIVDKDNWEPIKQGLFGGKYSDYFATYQEGEKFYNKNRY